MATTDQNFNVYAAAQQVVSAYLQAHNNTRVEAGNPLVAAISKLKGVVNSLPEYIDGTGKIVLTSGVVVTLPANATVKGVPDATITKATLYADANGVVQSVTLAV